MSEIEIWNELGNIYYNTGAYDEAIRAYSKAIEFDRACGQSYSNLASIYAHKGRHAEAISLLQRGIGFLEEATDKALLWNRLGDTYRKLDDYDNAIAAYRKAIELDPDNDTFRDNLAEAERDSARLTSESSVESSETIAEAEIVQGNPPSPELPVRGPACPGSEEANVTEPDPIETETVPEVFSTLSDTAENPGPETAGWVFKADGPAVSAEEATSSSPEPTPMILGSRILSDLPVENDAAKALDQSPELAEVEKPDATKAQTDQDNATSEADLEMISQVETGNIDSPSQQTDAAGDEVASQTPADPAMVAPDQIVAETSVVVLSPETEAGDTRDEDSKTSPTGQPEMDETTKARANALLQTGILHWRKGDYERASQFLNTALDLAAEFYDNRLKALCYNAIALVETDLGRTNEAVQAYESAASLDPGHIFPWNKLGNLYGQLERYEEALTAFQKGIKHNPKDAISWNGLGDVYHKLGRNEDAIAAYQLGNVFDIQNRNEDATTIYQMAFDANQENPRTLKEIGNIYYDAGAYDDAINAYAKAIELDPDNITLQDSLAKATSASEHVNSEADTESPAPMTEANQENLPSPDPFVAESTPSEPEETSSTGPDSSETERTDATETVPEALPNLLDSAEDSEPEAAYWVFKASTPLGNAPQPTVQPGVAIAETAVSAAKSSPVFAMPQFTRQALLNDHLITDAQKDAAVILVEQAPGTVESSEMEYVHPVVAQDDQDSTASEAEPEVSEEFPAMPAPIDALNPQATTAGNRIADQVETNLHNLENDIAAYRRVTEINPKNDRAWDALGNMYEAIGLHSEAIAAFEQAISLASWKEVYHYHLGLAHAAQTHYDKAIHALQKVVALNPDYMLAHCALAGYYRRIGKEAEAQEHITIARPTMENENEYNRACFESICGNVDRAIKFLKAALDKQQIQLDWIRSDPDLDFIRADPRFKALLHENGNRSQ